MLLLVQRDFNFDFRENPTFKDGTSNFGPNLPKAIYEHCSVALNSQEILIIGGDEGYNKLNETWIFNTETNEFKSGANMNMKRSSHGCTKYKSRFHNGREVVIAVGGYGAPYSAEIWDFTTGTDSWEMCKKKSFITKNC